MSAQATAVLAGKQESARDTLLRRALMGDVVFSSLAGLTFIVGSSWVSEFTGLSPSWVPAAVGAGVLGWVAGMAAVARAKELRASRVWIIIGGNIAWVIATYALLLTDVLDLTTAGAWTAGILAEIVALFAVAQYLGLRRLRT